jgi:hypothetical protein
MVVAEVGAMTWKLHCSCCLFEGWNLCPFMKGLNNVVKALHSRLKIPTKNVNFQFNASGKRTTVIKIILGSGADVVDSFRASSLPRRLGPLLLAQNTTRVEQTHLPTFTLL